MKNILKSVFECILEVLSIKWISHIYYVNMLSYHKHDYQPIEKGECDGITWPRSQCSDPECGHITGLEQWKINDLPNSMLYENKNKEDKKK